MVGYRWHDYKNIAPLFAFGHGLSYTTFNYGKVRSNHKKISSDENITFTLTVTNTGSLPGAEVIQLYIADPKCKVIRPTKELKEFAKVYLQPGESKEVTFTIGKDALSYFDAQSHQWIAEPGEYQALIGSASDDIRTSISFILK